jgi:membrane-bound serine protease (ClpP class)
MLLSLLILAAGPVRADAPVHVLDLHGTIGVGSADYVARGLDRAPAAGAGLIVLHMDTPGGLVSSTRRIIEAILASPVPVATFVAPSGAQAASAGTYIVYASHVAAMAPGTNIGAATPVQIGGLPGLPGEPPEDRGKRDERRGEPAPATGTAMERKAVNDAAAWLRSLAQLRGRNAEWAERAVREAVSITAQEAVQEKVVDLVAGDLGELLVRLDGRTVTVRGADRVLHTAGAPVVSLEPDWRARLLTVLTDPNIAFILMLVGIYGVIFEFFNPGFVLPGVAGGISLLLGLAGMALLPIDYAGLGLMLLGVALMIGEAVLPSAVLGVGGVAAFVLGAVFLFDEAPPGVDLSLSWPLILSTTAGTAAFLLLVIGMSLRARRKAVVSGREQMIGSGAQVLDWSGAEGRVRAHGEVWQARAHRPLAPGEAVRIVALEGLTLTVEPATPPRRPA